MIKRFFTIPLVGIALLGAMSVMPVHADDEPKPDAAGIKTGSAADAQDAAGNHFVISVPAELSADDKADTNKVAAYTDAKKAADDYAAQAKLEPLAVKLSDSVGHNRVAINFMWTLITGFLVMFMQAGFALVETGLCRAKNAGHTMSMNFMIYPMGMLGFYVCGFAFMFGGLGAIGTMGGYAGLNHEITVNLFGQALWHSGLEGIPAPRRRLRHGGVRAVPVPDGVHGHDGDDPDRRRGGALEILRVHDLRLLHRHHHVSAVRQLGLGWRLARAARLKFRPRPRPRGLRRLVGRAHARRRDLPDLLLADRPAPRQIRQERQDRSSDHAAQHPIRHAGHIHPGVRLVRIQSRLHSGGHRPAHRGGRREHHARLGHRRSGGDALDVVVQNRGRLVGGFPAILKFLI